MSSIPWNLRETAPWRSLGWMVGVLGALGIATSACTRKSIRTTETWLPTLVVTHDDTVVTNSCRVRIAPGAVLRDAKGDGVIQIAASDIVVEFESGEELWGQLKSDAWDRANGIGIRVMDVRNVRLRGGLVHGYKIGLLATRCPGLVVEGGDYSDNYRQRLKSTPLREDGADWLFPHHNDERRWRDEYGGAVCIEESQRVVIRGIRVRRGQNGIVLDRVDDSEVYDNDCSFLSGWGLALWRSNRNGVTRNAFDFCVRGHVEGVYNRGQDSAGILCFEQSNDNVFAENSVTHGGDGFFGFAGPEAIGESWMQGERERLRKAVGKADVDSLIRPPEDLVKRLGPLGCNRNWLVRNDFSYASAHGVEMTFSEDNRMIGNRIVGNAICGFWGGYSSGTWVLENEFSDNGGMAYGLERGAINMEHAADTLIARNHFRNNRCGVHLWWDEDPGLSQYPGVLGMERGIVGNVITGNRFEIQAPLPFARLQASEKLPVLQLRDPSGTRVASNAYWGNVVQLDHPQAVEFALEKGCEIVPRGTPPAPSVPALRVLGKTRPIGARDALRGREQIVMDEWGPWDHERPLIRETRSAAGESILECHGFSETPTVEVLSGEIRPEWIPGSGRRLRIASAPGYQEYRVRVKAVGYEREFAGKSLTAEWAARFFSWEKTTDPRERLAEWRKLAERPEAIRVRLAVMDCPFGMQGPASLGISAGAGQKWPGSERFGMIAQTRLALPAGRWRVKTLSDDGIRVRVDGQVVLENWSWHGPTEDRGTFTAPGGRPVEVEVEYFEIDGYAVLRCELEPETAER